MQYSFCYEWILAPWVKMDNKGVFRLEEYIKQLAVRIVSELDEVEQGSGLGHFLASPDSEVREEAWELKERIGNLRAKLQGIL